jgi:hypothetical protein
MYAAVDRRHTPYVGTMGRRNRSPGPTRQTAPLPCGSRHAPLEAWVDHPHRYLSLVRLVRVQLSAHHGRVEVLPAQIEIETLESQLAEVEVLPLKAIHLLDSALDFSVICIALRDWEGTRLSSRQHSLLDLARAIH